MMGGGLAPGGDIELSEFGRGVGGVRKATFWYQYGLFGVNIDFELFPHVIFGTNIDFEPWNKHLLGMKKRFSMFPEPQKLKNYDFLRFLRSKISKTSKNLKFSQNFPGVKKCLKSNLNT